jgi:hypothetical protein
LAGVRFTDTLRGAGPRNIKIVFVTAAAGRSGTTLIARLLGEIPGWVNVGEAQYLFDTKTRVGDPPCGCGKQVAACPFWKDIEEAIPDDAQNYARRWVRTRRFPLLLAGYRRGPLSPGFHRFLAVLQATYSEIARRAECRVIVDTTKSPWYPWALAQLASFDVYLLHLVRNPHAVVTSWSTRKNYIWPQPAWNVLARWSLHNMLFEWLAPRTRRYWRIRFEDFVRTPERMLESVVEQILGRPVALPFVGPGRARVGVQHILVSNADKFDCGEVVIRSDPPPLTTWSRRLLVGLFAFPLLRRYRYPF